MKLVYRVILSLCVLMVASAATAQARFVEGQHYRVIAEEASPQREVLEFFSFWCPHCFNFEPLVDQMKKRLDADVDFTKVHVNFMGFAGRDLQDDVTRAMLLGRALSREKALNTAIFNYIHRQRAPITNRDDIRSIFAVNDVAPKEFDKQITSFSLTSMLRKNNKTIDQYREHVSGVPNFIVNGKYQATFSRDMTPDDMIDLIVYLSELN